MHIIIFSNKSTLTSQITIMRVQNIKVIEFLIQTWTFIRFSKTSPPVPHRQI